jgi:hypothetical protein
MARRLILLGVSAIAAAVPLAAQGHGPAYGLSTPTLGRGGWSLDLGFMNRFVSGKHAGMSRPMLSYGVTEDLQASLSLPVPFHVPQEIVPTRGTTRMPATPDVELLLGWRFHRRGTAVGRRWETTTWVGLDYPTDPDRRGVRMAPGVYGAMVTGYASRTIYAWIGGLYRRYMTPTGPTADHPGDLGMYSLVLGWRPPPFRRDYPHPDWRIFLEVLGEIAARDVAAGTPRTDTGGHRILVGPTLLGLYGWWGISGGPLFPVMERLNGSQPDEALRLMLNVTFWF